MKKPIATVTALTIAVWIAAQAVGTAQSPPALSGSEPLPPLPDGAFTLVVIPDTQAYRGRGTKATPEDGDPVTNTNLESQVDWIVANRDSQNIVFVTHVGDIVDKNNRDQWTVAKKHLDKLRGIVPFSLTVGNHDMTSQGDARLFQSHFPATGFADEPWYLEAYGHDREDQHVSANNVNSAQIFSAGALAFLHLSLECNAPDDVLAWADGILKRHPERRAIITTHMNLGIAEKPKTSEAYIHDPKGRMDWIKIHGERGNTARQMWDKLYRKQSNLHFVLSGDQSRVTALHIEEPSDHGQMIHSLLSDYMSQPALRLMRFLPGENRIDVLTFQVQDGFLVEETRHVSDREQHQFSLEYSMTR